MTIPPPPPAPGAPQNQPGGNGQQPPQYQSQPQYGPPQPPAAPPYNPQQQYGGTEGPDGASDPNDLKLPLRGASFQQSIVRWIKNYVNFEGRASRPEFWWVALLLLGVNIVTGIIDDGVSSAIDLTVSPVSSLVSLALLLPNLGLTVRRFHDTGRSGWWVLINLIPIVGWIISIVFLAGAPSPQGRQYDRR